MRNFVEKLKVRRDLNRTKSFLGGVQGDINALWRQRRDFREAGKLPAWRKALRDLEQQEEKLKQKARSLQQQLDQLDKKDR